MQWLSEIATNVIAADHGYNKPDNSSNISDHDRVTTNCLTGCLHAREDNKV